MNNYFETLNDALDSEGLIDRWPITASVPYGATAALAIPSPGDNHSKVKDTTL